MGRATMEGNERDTALVLAVREIEELKREIQSLRMGLAHYYKLHLDHVMKSADHKWVSIRKGEQE